MMSSIPFTQLLIQITVWSLLGLGLLLVVNRYFPRHLAGQRLWADGGYRSPDLIDMRTLAELGQCICE
ncbi:MAG: hypothetical protein QM703_21010 [Gemmatales bacterium]